MVNLLLKYWILPNCSRFTFSGLTSSKHNYHLTSSILFNVLFSRVMTIFLYFHPVYRPLIVQMNDKYHLYARCKFMDTCILSGGCRPFVVTFVVVHSHNLRMLTLISRFHAMPIILCVWKFDNSFLGNIN